MERVTLQRDKSVENVRIYFASENPVQSFGKRRSPLKPALIVNEKTIVVIDQTLVDLMKIDGDTWFEQQITNEGIFLKLRRGYGSGTASL